MWILKIGGYAQIFLCRELEETNVFDMEFIMIPWVL